MDEETLNALPGSEIVRAGLADIRADRLTPEAWALRMAASRLRSVGVAVPESTDSEPASHRLYELLAAEDSDSAHSKFNAIARRLASFAASAEHARAR